QTIEENNTTGWLPPYGDCGRAKDKRGIQVPHRESVVQEKATTTGYATKRQSLHHGASAQTCQLVAEFFYQHPQVRHHLFADVDDVAARPIHIRIGMGWAGPQAV